jgi:phage-related protein
MKDGKQNLKSVLWVSSSRRDLIVMPKKVVTNFGYAIYQAQIGTYPDIAKPSKGFGCAHVIELVENYKSDTFRAVYTPSTSNLPNWAELKALAVELF